MDKKGFKQTELGLIPEDWEVNSVGEIAPLQRGFDLPINKIIKGKYPIVYSNGILNYHYKAMVKGPGIVTGRSGTIGKVTYVTSDYWPHNTSLWVTDFKNNNPKFIYYLFLHLELSRFASGTGVPTLNRNEVHSTKISFPSTFVEQTAIATALSDVDALISALDKKITKKKQIKRGAMQQLLTGKKRLPGFSGEWTFTVLGSESHMGSGGTPLSSIPEYYDGKIPFLSISDITLSGKYINSTEKTITDLGLRNSSARMFPKGTVMYAMYASLGKCAIANIDLTCSQAILGIVPKSTLNKQFLYYYLTYIEDVVKQLGQTGTQANLSKELVQKFELYITKDFAEQTAIAQILSDMDNEIEALGAKREKYIGVKQGMMQNLLSGQIRLV